MLWWWWPEPAPRRVVRTDEVTEAPEQVRETVAVEQQPEPAKRGPANPPDPVETGPCSLELALYDAWTGAAIRGTVRLYRLDAPEDAFELGIEDAFVDAICLIEWASRLGPLLPRQALRLSIEPASAEAGVERRIVSMSGGARWQPVFAALREAFAAPS